MSGVESPIPEPISPGRFVLGSLLILGYHIGVGAVLEAAAFCKPRFRPVARFHRIYLLDILAVVSSREGIRIDRQKGFETGLERR